MSTNKQADKQADEMIALLLLGYLLLQDAVEEELSGVIDEMCHQVESTGSGISDMLNILQGKDISKKP